MNLQKGIDLKKSSRHTLPPQNPFSLNTPIPRQASRKEKSLTSNPSLSIMERSSHVMDIPVPRRTRPHADVNNGRVKIISEFPFKISIRTHDMKILSSTQPKKRKISISLRSIQKKNTSQLPSIAQDAPRTSGRRSVSMNKRKSYAEELRDTDSDDLLSDTDEELKHLTKKRSLSKGKNDDVQSSTSNVVAKSNSSIALPETEIEAPPPGVLSTLWYSREVVIHIWAIEKIISWKKRPTCPKLVYDPAYLPKEKLDVYQVSGGLDFPTSTALSGKLVNDRINDVHARMEISRINPAKCPSVLHEAVKNEAKRALNRKESPHYMFSSDSQEKGIEEVLLIKWRGRSYLHCSWERARDLERFDPTNNTAKGKIRRYYQTQEVLLGKGWKSILESNGQTTKSNDDEVSPREKSTESIDSIHVEEEDALFSPDFTEVERILACDEGEMDPLVLAKQRALNFRAEEEAAKKREEALSRVEDGQVGAGVKSEIDDNQHKNMEALAASSAKSTQVRKEEVEEPEEPWDPEDNVRYVVKWKGLQFSEITWEYWRHIKRDAVDQAEDFWHRQSAPTPEEVKAATNRVHPHMREYKKLHESPVFGLSCRKRPIATLDDGLSQTLQETTSSEIDEVESEGVSLRLRPYQLEGVNWLLWNWWNKRSCILADEMGLGKTIQSMCFLDCLYKNPASKVRGPFIVVAPLTLVRQWQSESTTWAPDLNVLLYHGSMDARDFLVKQEFYYSDQFIPKTQAIKLKRQHITKFHILITTYEVAMKDISVLSRIRWKALIVDEAHRLKNNQSRLFSDLASLPREFCLLLTGTPLQNSTEELWSLLNFSDPLMFASKEDFVAKFGQLTDAQQVSELHSILRPYLLRRVKEDVEKSLPPKSETIMEVALTPIQKTYYKAIYEKNTSFLFKGSKPGNAPSLMNIMMELRKCCNHPFLIKGAEERIIADADNAEKRLSEEKKRNGNDENNQVTSSALPEDPVRRWHALLSDQLVKSSGKMVLLTKLLPKLKSGGHKVLIFSQMVRVLDLLEELLRFQSYKYERLDGSTGASARASAVDRFNRKSFQRFVMLLSTRAGGLGLNLTSADTIVIFDSDWNPQNDLQAMARAHRIGQTRAVRVYRFLTAKTYEMHMFHSASMKLGLDRAVLAHQRQQDEDEDQSSSQMSSAKKSRKTKSEKEMQAKEIDQLLKKGAYDVFRDDDDSEAKKFMESDIDQLLNSSQTVTYGPGEGASSMSNGLGSFSKASFVTGDADGRDVDLDDPNFWEKAVGLDAPSEANIDENMALMLDGDKKRSRKQVQQFDPYASFHEAEQKKIDRKKLEKEEKDRLKAERKKQRKEEKERKKCEKKSKESSSSSKEKKQKDSGGVDRNLNGSGDFNVEKEKKNKLGSCSNQLQSSIQKKFTREMKLKKLKRLEKKRVRKVLDREDPISDRIKQAWEKSHRDRVSEAAILFGFERFCKIRNESNLSSIPIQDIEVFLRQYIYQLGLQASFNLLEIQSSSQLKPEKQFDEIYAKYGQSDGEWIARAMLVSMKAYSEINKYNRLLRIPKTLVDKDFISRLRGGKALRALRCFALLSRFNRLFKDSIDHILQDLGHEELGKRGCTTKDLSTLDIDLKARHVTVEELSHTLGEKLVDNWKEKHLSQWSPTPWWDRSCDISLLIGTFIHGLGNYEAMFNDKDLPFVKKMQAFAERNLFRISAFDNFILVSESAKKVFDDTLDKIRNKNQTPTNTMQMSKPDNCEEDKNKNPIILPNMDQNLKGDSTKANIQHETKTSKNSPLVSSELDKKQKPIMPVSLQDLSNSIKSTMQSNIIYGQKKSNIWLSNDKKFSVACKLSLPDSNVLDSRVGQVLALVESVHFKIFPTSTKSISLNKESTNIHLQSSDECFSYIEGNYNVAEKLSQYRDIFAYRKISSNVPYVVDTLYEKDRDSSFYPIGAVSKDIIGAGVPTRLTKYGLTALAYADKNILDKLTEMEGTLMEKNLVDNKKDSSLSSQVSMGKLLDPKKFSGNSEAKLKKQEENADSKFIFDIRIVPSELRVDPELRAAFSAAILQSGWIQSFQSQNCNINIAINDVCFPNSTESSFSQFNSSSLMKVVSRYYSKNVMMDENDIHSYLKDILIPHCVRLCLSNNYCGDDAKWNPHYNTKSQLDDSLHYKLKYDGIFLPDPLAPIHIHCRYSITVACAILRRVKLMSAIRFIMSGKIPHELIEKVLKSKTVREHSDGIPIWWCPWIHDIALLVHAVRYGLLSIVEDRKDSERMNRIGSVFDLNEIEKHTRSVLFNGTLEQKPLISKKVLTKLSVSEVKGLVDSYICQFPSMNSIEQRLGFICEETQKAYFVDRDALRKDHEDFFLSLPMFDDCGWTRYK